MKVSRSAYFAAKRNELDRLGRVKRLEPLADPLVCAVCGVRIGVHEIRACWREVV